MNIHEALAEKQVLFMPVSLPPRIDFCSLLCYNSGVEESMKLSLLNQYAGVIAVSYKFVYFDLAEVIYFMKEGDFSFFDFGSYYGQTFAEVYTNEAGELRIYNVPDNDIPAETVRLVLDVLEHWDECLEQAYNWLRFYSPENDEWNPKKEWPPKKKWSRDFIEKESGVSALDFGEEGWPKRTFREYRLDPKPKKGSEYFSIDFCLGDFPLGFCMKYLCEDRRLYQIETYIK